MPRKFNEWGWNRAAVEITVEDDIVLLKVWLKVTQLCRRFPISRPPVES